jgi:hypothetical protein
MEELDALLQWEEWEELFQVVVETEATGQRW